jgi:hypothetical protein
MLVEGYGPWRHNVAGGSWFAAQKPRTKSPLSENWNEQPYFQRARES